MAIDPNQIREYLQGIKFPVAKDDLADQLRGKGAPDQIVSFVQSLPMDEIKSPGDIFRALNPMG